jgi:thermitase
MSASRRSYILSGLLILLLLAGALLLVTRAVEAASTPQEDYVPGELIVGLADGVQPSDVVLPDGASFAATSSGLKNELHAILVKVPVGQEASIRQQLLKLPSVLFVEFDYIIRAELTPNDPLWAPGTVSPASPLGQYGPQKVDAPAAWDRTTGSSNVTLAIVDSGLDRGHPEFSGRVLQGYDFVDNDTNPQDACGHGTHVAGIAAAAGNNAIGIAGIDWHVTILPVRVLDQNCSGSLSTVAAGIVWATDQGAKVMNLSLGTSIDSTLLEDATYYAYQHGVAVIAAAGNSGSSPIMYPARFPWVLSVGATDQNNVRMPESDYGSDLDLVAPGYEILSTTPRTAFTFQYLLGVTQQYGVMSGTSMAAAHVSGAAALLLSWAPDRFNHPLKLYQALTATAVPLGDANEYGSGLLDINAALDFIPTVVPPTPVTSPVRYEWAASNQCQNIAFSWLDATSGTALFIPGNDDSATVALPFTFDYAGENYNSALVSANGFLTFDTTTTLTESGENFSIPGIAPPNQFIAPFWDDLNPSANASGSGIYVRAYGTAPNRQWVVEWYQIPLAANPGSRLTFEAILYETSNQIKFQYLTLNGDGATGASATVGLEYLDGQAGVQAAYEQSGALSQNEAIQFYPVSSDEDSQVPGCVSTTHAGASGTNIQQSPFCLEIPAGTLNEDTLVRLEVLRQFSPVPSNYVDLKHYLEIQTDPNPGSSFSTEPRVCYSYSAQDILKAGGHPENLFIAVFENGSWQSLPTLLDEDNTRIWAYLPHFSTYGVFALSPQQLPVTGVDLSYSMDVHAWLIICCSLGIILVGVLKRKL